MGMFDYITVEAPLPDGAPPPGECQTKSFPDPDFNRYRLSADGRLHRKIVRFEETAATDLLGYPVMRRIDLGEEPCHHLGLVVFHCGGGSEWKPYTAAIYFGRLIDIRAGEEEAWATPPEGPPPDLWEAGGTARPAPPDRKSLDALLAEMPTPEETAAAERRVLERLVADAGGDASAVSVVSNIPTPWQGFGDDARVEVVEDAAGRRFAVMHNWGEAQVLGPGAVDEMRAYLARQIEALDGVARHLAEGRTGA